MPAETLKRRSKPPGLPPGRSVVVMTISVPRELDAFMREYAHARGVSLSLAVSELLFACKPALEQTVEALRLAESGPANAIALMKRSLDSAMGTAKAAQGQLDLAAARKGGRSDAPKM